MIDQNHAASIRQRMFHMVANVRSRMYDPKWRRLAVRIINGRNWSTERNPSADIQAIYDFVLDNIRYTSDPRGRDVYYPPETALELRAGDCDEMSTLISLLLETLGYPTKFRSVSRGNGKFSHVYAMVSPSKKREGPWLAADTVLRQGVGAEVRYVAKMDVEV